ncbi:MAG TPA: CoA transferase, partial [Burkholderiaceae bacterium]|nr:CoA transferase [Burkholderiaceae bacterium]
VSDAQWQAFCRAFDLPEWAADPLLATNNQRVQARERFMPRLRDVLRGWRKAELMARADAAGLPFAPIARPEDLYDDPHLNASGAFTEVTLADGRPARVPRLPIRMGEHALGTRRDLPAIGADTADVLAELGYNGEQIERLRTAGAIGSPRPFPQPET